MAIVPGQVILDAAEQGNYGVPALNINEMLQLQAYMNAAYELNSSLILQASMGSRGFTGWLSAFDPDPDLGARVTMDFIHSIDKQYSDKYGYQVPIAVTLDHGPNVKECIAAVDAGFNMVMIDGSLDYDVTNADGKHPPRDLEGNIAITKQVVDYAHLKGVAVEGELGTLGGIEGDTAASKVNKTEPDEVEIYVAKSGADALAVAIGTSHGAYKFKTAPTLDIPLVGEIQQRAGRTRLVMHGSSSVPPDLVAKIDSYPVMHVADNKLELTGYFSGVYSKTRTRTYNLSDAEQMAQLGVHLQEFSCLKKSMGVPIEQIQEAIKLGIRKINVDTDGRLGTTGAIRQNMAEKQDNFDQRKYFEKARVALYDMAVKRIQGFGSQGKADGVEIITMKEQAQRYAA